MLTTALAERGHVTRLLAGNATTAGVKLAGAHDFEVEVMGSGVDLQWHCEPSFAAWLAPRLAGSPTIAESWSRPTTRRRWRPRWRVS